MTEEHIDEGESERVYDAHRALARIHYKDQNELSWDEANALWEGLHPGSDENPLGDPEVTAEAARRAAQPADAGAAAGDEAPAAGGEPEAEGAAADAQPPVAEEPAPGADEGAGAA